MSAWESWFGPRVVVMEPSAMGERERRAALAVARDNALFQAVLSVIEDHIADATELVAAMQTSTNAQHVTHAAGQLDALRGLREDLERLRAEAEEKAES